MQQMADDVKIIVKRMKQEKLNISIRCLIDKSH